jgi:hypothetical protein
MKACVIATILNPTLSKSKQGAGGREQGEQGKQGKQGKK